MTADELIEYINSQNWCITTIPESEGYLE
jgi:hypothetical protein